MSLSPYEQMAAMYEANPQERSFEWYCEWHMRHGFLFSTPVFFIMGRAVNKGFVERHGLPLQHVPREFADTWYIHAMAGDMTRAWDILPYPLPWLAWERILDGKRELRFYSAAEVKRLCTHPHAA
jgi:hypothetical protein